MTSLFHKYAIFDNNIYNMKRANALRLIVHE